MSDVEIVEGGEPTDPPHLEFRVYRSPKDGQTVLGYLSAGAIIHSEGRQATWLGTPYGTPVTEAYRRALGLACQIGAKRMYVRDPEGLYPPHIRPTS